MKKAGKAWEVIRDVGCDTRGEDRDVRAEWRDAETVDEFLEAISRMGGGYLVRIARVIANGSPEKMHAIAEASLIALPAITHAYGTANSKKEMGIACALIDSWDRASRMPRDATRGLSTYPAKMLVQNFEHAFCIDEAGNFAAVFDSLDRAIGTARSTDAGALTLAEFAPMLREGLA
jgi:hypothetical protein